MDFTPEQHDAIHSDGVDLVVVDTDLLECPVDKIRDAQVHSTWLGGKIVYEKK